MELAGVTAIAGSVQYSKYASNRITVIGHGLEVALGEDGEFVGGYHSLGSGIEVARNIAAIVALEGLQAYVTHR